MKLTLEGLKEKEKWADNKIMLPEFDIENIRRNTVESPEWIHFGIGNIFRIFLGGIADSLLDMKLMDKGITCVETFDFEVVDKIYVPYDNLALSVGLCSDGKKECRVIGSLAEAISAIPGNTEAFLRLKDIFAASGLKLVSFTITEKGYALKDTDGNYLPSVKNDLEKGPEGKSLAMTLISSLLYERYKAGKRPIALVSMDNVSQNGKKLRESVLDIVKTWEEGGFVPKEFTEYASDESKVSFPWTMIDKITPRPGKDIAEYLEDIGIEDMSPVITSKQTYIAPFVNAETVQYLVIEDSFPNGRPPFEKAGVYMTARDIVNKSERMKVTAALNPLHKPLGYFGCLFSYKYVSDAMKDKDILLVVKTLGLKEGMKVVEDPGIITPSDFINEVINERFSNPYIPDTPERLVVDSSQMMSAMFGETAKAYVKKFGSASELIAFPLTIAAWFRYLLAVDDNGMPLTLQADPLLGELKEKLKTVEFGNSKSYKGQLKPIISNANIFGCDLIEAGLGDKIEEMFVNMIKGKGAVRKTLASFRPVLL